MSTTPNNINPTTQVRSYLDKIAASPDYQALTPEGQKRLRDVAYNNDIVPFYKSLNQEAPARDIFEPNYVDPRSQYQPDNLARFGVGTLHGAGVLINDAYKLSPAYYAPKIVNAVTGKLTDALPEGKLKEASKESLKQAVKSSDMMDSIFSYPKNVAEDFQQAFPDTTLGNKVSSLTGDLLGRLPGFSLATKVTKAIPVFGKLLDPKTATFSSKVLFSAIDGAMSAPIAGDEGVKDIPTYAAFGAVGTGVGIGGWRGAKALFTGIASLGSHGATQILTNAAHMAEGDIAEGTSKFTDFMHYNEDQLTKAFPNSIGGSPSIDVLNRVAQDRFKTNFLTLHGSQQLEVFRALNINISQEPQIFANMQAIDTMSAAVAKGYDLIANQRFNKVFKDLGATEKQAVIDEAATFLKQTIKAPDPKVAGVAAAAQVAKSAQVSPVAQQVRSRVNQILKTFNQPSVEETAAKEAERAANLSQAKEMVQADNPTVSESFNTVQAQLSSLVDGRKDSVYIPKGTQYDPTLIPKTLADGRKIKQTPFKNGVRLTIKNPKEISLFHAGDYEGGTFDTSKSSSVSQFGQAAYLTDNEQVATGFGKSINKPVKKLVASPKNLLDFSSPVPSNLVDSLTKEVDAQTKWLPEIREGYKRAFAKVTNVKELMEPFVRNGNTKLIQNAVRNAGYDAIKDGSTYAIYDGTKIKPENIKVSETTDTAAQNILGQDASKEQVLANAIETGQPAVTVVAENKGTGDELEAALATPQTAASEVERLRKNFPSAAIKVGDETKAAEVIQNRVDRSIPSNEATRALSPDEINIAKAKLGAIENVTGKPVKLTTKSPTQLIKDVLNAGGAHFNGVTNNTSLVINGKLTPMAKTVSIGHIVMDETGAPSFMDIGGKKLLMTSHGEVNVSGLTVDKVQQWLAERVNKSMKTAATIKANPAAAEQSGINITAAIGMGTRHYGIDDITKSIILRNMGIADGSAKNVAPEQVEEVLNQFMRQNLQSNAWHWTGEVFGDIPVLSNLPQKDATLKYGFARELGKVLDIDSNMNDKFAALLIENFPDIVNTYGPSRNKIFAALKDASSINPVKYRDFNFMNWLKEQGYDAVMMRPDKSQIKVVPINQEVLNNQAVKEAEQTVLNLKAVKLDGIDKSSQGAMQAINTVNDLKTKTQQQKVQVAVYNSSGKLTGYKEIDVPVPKHNRIVQERPADKEVRNILKDVMNEE